MCFILCLLSFRFVSGCGIYYSFSLLFTVWCVLYMNMIFHVPIIIFPAAFVVDVEGLSLQVDAHRGRVQVSVYIHVHVCIGSL